MAFGLRLPDSQLFAVSMEAPINWLTRLGHTKPPADVLDFG